MSASTPPQAPTRERTRRSIALVGTYSPRQCGIATFTEDLARSLANRSQVDVGVVAINDTRDGYDYKDEVRFEIGQKALQDYRLAADHLNIAHVDAVCLQHEYGIYGGDDGRHVLRLLGQLRMPVITTVHTIIQNPTPSQRAVVTELAKLSDRLVTMTETGRHLLVERYGVLPRTVAVIPHGIPDLPFVDPNYYKDQLGVAGKRVILTFGLISPGKGLEYVIRALPAIASKHPDAVYVVVGATHPQVRRTHGEAYRHSLQLLASDLGVDDRVVFHDRYVEKERLCEFLGAADAYVTPYLGEDQVVSGTLAYAMGAGKAVISTPYLHAAEALAQGRGRLVPFRDADAFADAINELFDHDADRHAMRKAAYDYSRGGVWSVVGTRYMDLVEEILVERERAPRARFSVRTERSHETRLPTIDLQHLLRLTDDTGLLQHAQSTIPDRSHGYCTDDNARALLLAVRARPHLDDTAALDGLTVRYLSFLQHAFRSDERTFKNLLDYDRRWNPDGDSEDCQGRAVWALGVSAAELEDEAARRVATSLLLNALPGLEGLGSPRAVSQAALGLTTYLRASPGDSAVKRTRSFLANRLLEAFQASEDAAWPWPESRLTYSNAVLPHALLEIGVQTDHRGMIDTGLSALSWLVKLQTSDGRFTPVGNRGWFDRGGEKARFDQQPIEAEATIAACIAAHNATGQRRWIEEAIRAFRWFLGDNDIGTPTYDHASGGCRDGIGPAEANSNEGAESTLAWLSSLVQLHDLQARGALGWTRDTRSGEVATATQERLAGSPPEYAAVAE